MPKFHLRNPDGSRGDAVEYLPLAVDIDGTPEALALHRPDKQSEWIVSDPASGARVHRLWGTYKGCPCTSAHLTQSAAAMAARAQVADLADRVGVEKFRATLAKARKRYGTTAAA
ncbi:hypothetical protein [Azohydromonas aeria]|uniref:hypothetical protein n=1 Tax=Azohydromonas aeria TaxID=2590212 RepID=UPI0012F81FBB|nr:hypothetical protein [Azohydromonas aeria]